MSYESMVFYKSFYDAICGLEKELQAEIYDAIIYYGIYGEEKELSPMAKMAFALIKPQIDANNRRKENGKKGADYGKLGGRPKKNNPTETPKEPQINPTETPKEPQINPTETPNVKVNDNANVNDNDKNIDKDNKGKKPKAFTPPTLEEIQAYIKERGSNVDAKRFYDYYEQGGWKDSSGKPVRNWKQKMIAVWEKDKPVQPKPQNSFCNFKQNDIDYDELAKKVYAN